MNLIALGVALAITAYSIVDMMLHWTPFWPSVSQQRKRRVVLLYGILCLVNVAAIYFLMNQSVRSPSVIKNDIYIMDIAAAVVAIAVTPERLREHLFVYGITSICTYLLTPFATQIAWFLGVYGMGDTFLVGSVSFTLLVIAAYYPIRSLLKYTVEPFLSVDNGDYWNLICLVSVSLFLAMRFALPWNVTSETWLDIGTRIMFGAVTVLICITVAQDHKKLRTHELMVEQLANQKAHYAVLQQQMEDARKTRHDMKHFISAVQHFINTDDKSGLQDYCQELASVTLDKETIPYTGNPAADGVLYRYQRLAAEQGIDFHYSGRIKSQGIANVDLCVVLGNALENALTACAELQGPRYIQLFAQTEPQLLSLVIRNSFDGEVREKDGVLLSRKRENEPGVGMASMQKVCQRYGGTMEFQWDEEAFTLLIMLPITAEA